ncbi:hypothetical protein IWQ51_003031 [Labrenzia sp. EL_142]|nr:hypothetical protein [Labrenzia sp. EL_142]
MSSPLAFNAASSPVNLRANWLKIISVVPCPVTIQALKIRHTRPWCRLDVECVFLFPS